MIECWANVYQADQAAWAGIAHPDREAAEYFRGCDCVAVVHIRLKPEGAPRRYASDKDRQNWEEFPEEMRTCPF